MWVRIDDDVPNHPKFIKAGPVASWLWLAANCYCSKYLTDGFVENAMVTRLGVPLAKRYASVLVSAGLWELCEGGYRIHDYHDHNPTAEEVRANRMRRAEQGRLGGLAKAVALRQANAKPSAKPLAKLMPSKPPSKNVADIDVDKDVDKEVRVAEPKSAPPVTEFLTWFQEEYKKRRDGATYCVIWAKHGAIIKRLLQTYPTERLRRHAVVMLTATSDDYIEQSDRGIEVFAGKINWLEERLCAWEVKRKAREEV